jgi:hypothetical protein
VVVDGVVSLIFFEGGSFVAYILLASCFGRWTEYTEDLLLGCCLDGGTQVSTLAAERQVRDFLIGPRNKKQRKKRSTIKILHPPFQITSWHFRENSAHRCRCVSPPPPAAPPPF